MLKKFIDKRYKLCILVKGFAKKFEEKVCFSKEDLAEIKEKVDATYRDAEQFERAKGMLPQVQELVQENKENLEVCNSYNKYLENTITEIFHADIIGDNKKKFELYSYLDLTVDKLN